jgi:hypothetical protein
MQRKPVINYNFKLTHKTLGLSSSIVITGSVDCPDITIGVNTQHFIEEARRNAAILAVGRANSVIVAGFDDYEPWPCSSCVDVFITGGEPGEHAYEVEATHYQRVAAHRHYGVSLFQGGIALLPDAPTDRPTGNEERLREIYYKGLEMSKDESAPAPAPFEPPLRIIPAVGALSSGLLLLCVMALGLLTGCDSPKDYSGPDEALHVAQGHTLGGAL